jgi:hypothetical protein
MVVSLMCASRVGSVQGGGEIERAQGGGFQGVRLLGVGDSLGVAGDGLQHAPGGGLPGADEVVQHPMRDLVGVLQRLATVCTTVAAGTGRAAVSVSPVITAVM